MEIKSKLGIGTAQFGLNYGINNSSGRLSKLEIARILHFAIKEGISLLDTAQGYGDAETSIGNIIKQENINHRFGIITKISATNIYQIENSVKDSIARLQCHHLYGVLFHDFDSFQKNTTSIIKMEQLKQEGIIKKFGFSLYHPEQLDSLINDKISFDIIQVPYNLFDRRFESYFPDLNTKGIEVHVRSIFLQGLFLMELESLSPWFDKIRSKLHAIRQMADTLKITVSSLCLNFGLLNKHIDKVIIGIDNLDQLENNVTSVKEANTVLSAYNDLLCMEEKDDNIILPYLWKP